MYKSYVPYLQHILDECLYVRSVITDDMQIEEFLRDETLKRAVTRSLSIIGEATKKIPGLMALTIKIIKTFDDLVGVWTTPQVCVVKIKLNNKQI